ncbi:MAG: hypothetical protein AAFP18_14210 [Bacteroidota bacterium]
MDLIAHPFSPLVVAPPLAAAAIVMSLAVRSKRLPGPERATWRARLFWATLAFWSCGAFASAWLIAAALAGPLAEVGAIAAGTHIAFWFTAAAAAAVGTIEAIKRAAPDPPRDTSEADEDYDPAGLFEPSLRGRLMMVGVTIGCFLIGFIPETWYTFASWSYLAAHVFALAIFANYIFDGRPGTLAKIKQEPSETPVRPNPRLHADEGL